MNLFTFVLLPIVPILCLEKLTLPKIWLKFHYFPTDYQTKLGITSLGLAEGKFHFLDATFLTLHASLIRSPNFLFSPLTMVTFIKVI